MKDAETRWSWVLHVGTATQAGGAAACPCLLAHAEHTTRRFWTFAADWRSLDDVALLALVNDPPDPPPHPTS